MNEREHETEESTLRAIADNIRRVEEMLRFLPLPEATLSELRKKIALLRTTTLEQRPPAFALVGRRGAGKSSLVNALFGARVAEVGHVKAQTGKGRWFDHKGERGTLSILDTRGVHEGSAPEESDDSKDALTSICNELKKKKPDIVVFVVKATEVDSAIENDLLALERVYAEVEREHRIRPPLVVLATHCDVLEPKGAQLHVAAGEAPDDIEEKLARVREVEHHLEAKVRSRAKLGPHLVWTRGLSAYLSFKPDGTIRADERWRIDELVGTLFRYLPDDGRGSFVRIAQVRALQEELASNLTRATAALCAGVAALPIPVADVIPITSLQLSLVASIAWISGRPLSKGVAAEFLSAMGANIGVAFAFREGARALIKFVFPGGGSMISGAVAFGGTIAVGAAARAYFLRGVSVDEAKRVFAEERAEERKESGTQGESARDGDGDQATHPRA